MPQYDVLLWPLTRCLPTRYSENTLSRAPARQEELLGSHAPLLTTITSPPNSTNGLTPSARTNSNEARATPASNMALAMRKERKRRIGDSPTTHQLDGNLAFKNKRGHRFCSVLRETFAAGPFELLISFAKEHFLSEPES